MTEPYRPSILASDYARQIGLTTDAVVKRIQKGKLMGHKLGDRWYVEIDQAIPGQAEHTDGPSVAAEPPSTLMPTLPQMQAQLAALEAYNQRLIAPWVSTVADLRRELAEEKALRVAQASEIGDLKRQVRELKQDLAALQRRATIAPQEG